MRVVVGSVVLARAGSKLWTGEPLATTLTSAFLAGSGLLLIAGLWTPLAGTVVAMIATSQILSMAPDRLVCLLAGTVGGALAMLGPVAGRSTLSSSDGSASKHCHAGVVRTSSEPRT